MPNPYLDSGPVNLSGVGKLASRGGKEQIVSQQHIDDISRLSPPPTELCGPKPISHSPLPKLCVYASALGYGDQLKRNTELLGDELTYVKGNTASYLSVRCSRQQDRVSAFIATRNFPVGAISELIAGCANGTPRYRGCDQYDCQQQNPSHKSLLS